MAARRKRLHVLVLAAGLGKRMKSARAKLLHEVAGRPMVCYVLEAVRGLRPERRLVVLGHQADLLRRLVPREFEVVLQAEQRGTGHAVLQAEGHLSRAGAGDVLILNGDLPGIRTDTLRRFVSGHRASGAAASLMTAVLDDPTGYGRVVRDEKGVFLRIVEHADAGASQRRLREVNAGVYCFSTEGLFRSLRALRPSNKQKEYYLPDVLTAVARRGLTVRAVRQEQAWEVLGVNSRAELTEISRRLYARRALEAMNGGVTIADPATAWIDADVVVGPDTVIHPNVHLQGNTRIGSGVVVGSGCVIRDCRIADGVTLLPYCVLSDSVVDEGARIGPFSHLRPGTRLHGGVHIGNFVEVKKSEIGAGSKANHLSYLGDANVGADVNIGAGTITCNYDGVNKNQTVVEEGVFIGSDTALVAPVRVGKGAYVGAGSIITMDVPPGALALARGRQTNIEGWVERKKQQRDGVPAAKVDGSAGQPPRRRGARK